MYFHLLTCLLVTLVTAVTSQGFYEDCCLKYSKRPKLAHIRNIRQFKVQRVNGSCNLRAVVFELRKKNYICGNPEEKWVQDTIRNLEKKASFMKSKKESKKHHGGNNTNITRPLTQNVQLHHMHGIGRNQSDQFQRDHHHDVGTR